MQIAVAGLPTELSDALLSLAVFPADTQISVAAITRYWAHTRACTTQQTSRDLDTLAAANLVHRDQDAVGFHDLQHDYLLLHAPQLALLHAELLDAYRALLPADSPDQWARLPGDEPYVWEHLAAHLAGAGERTMPATTVTDPAYLVRRITTGGVHAVEADLARATAVLSDHRLIRWWQGWISRHAHLLTLPNHAVPPNDGSVPLAPTMLAWLTADRSLPNGLDPERLEPLLPTPYLRVRWGLAPQATTLVRLLSGDRFGAAAWPGPRRHPPRHRRSGRQDLRL